MIFSGLLAYYFDRKAEDTVPSAFFLLMILLYVLGIIGRIRHGVLLLGFFLVFMDFLLFFCIGHRWKKKINKTLNKSQDFKYVLSSSEASANREATDEPGIPVNYELSADSGNFANSEVSSDPKITSGAEASAGLGVPTNLRAVLGDFLSVYRTPGLFVLFIVLLFFGFLYRNSQVLNWDDLNYWALFPRNMYAIDGVPTGAMSVSRFRDYLPIVQYAYFAVFKVIGRFSESAMFIVNETLILLSLSPFFIKSPNNTTFTYFLKVLAGMIFPYLCMMQPLYCLGVDSILTCLFGYLIVSIHEERRDTFHYLRIAILIAMLLLTKAAGIFPAAVGVLLFAIDEGFGSHFAGAPEKMSSWLKKTAIVSFPGFLLFLSWKVFCILKGNSSYLSDRFGRNLAGGSDGPALPEYAGFTIAKFIRAFFNFNLNGGDFGITPAIALGLFLAVFFLCLKCRKSSLSVRSGIFQRPGVFISLGGLLIGYIGYCLMLVYVYIWVFDEWEARSLSSYDRYMTVFSGLFLYLALYMGLEIFTQEKARMSSSQAKNLLDKLRSALMPVLLILLALTMNYPLIYESFNDGAFKIKNSNQIEVKGRCEEEFGRLFAGEGKEMRAGQKLLIVDEEQDNELIQFTRYAAVPVVTEYLSLDGEDADSDKAMKKIYEKCKSEKIDFVYLRGQGLMAAPG